MLKISEFAKLAHTTRRTLIIYDRNNLFKPAQVNEEGYRFYEYDQIYEMSFILTLRKLGLSIDEIKQISSLDKKESPDELLLNLKAKVNHQIQDLLKVNDSLDQRMVNISQRSQPHLYQAYTNTNQQTYFWKSIDLNDCSPQQVAKAFSDFYNQLDHFSGINGTCSGFLVNLPQLETKIFDQAIFNLIKATPVPTENEFITTIDRPAGDYIAVDVESDVGSSCLNTHRGLNILKKAVADQGLQIEDKLWEINLGEDIRFSNATSSVVRLELKIA